MPVRTRPAANDHRLDLALAALLLAVVAPFVQTIVAQNALRYTLTAALLEHRTVQLDRYEDYLTIDQVELDGHVYADKAPGQPMLGVPVLATAEALGADPATETRFRGNLGAWSQSLAFCAIPAAVLLVLMRRHAARTQSRRAAAEAALALGFGSLLLPFASTLYAHVFVAALTFAAWHLVSRTSASSLGVLAAGTCCAVATFSEYPMFAVAGLLGLAVFRRHGFRASLIFAAPQGAAIAGLLAYHQVVFGTWTSGYAAKSSGGEPGVGSLPDLGHLWQMFFGVKGLMFTPVVLVGVVGIALGWRRWRSELVVPAGVFLGFAALQAGWSNPWGGEAPGPRYLTPAMPFLVVPVAIGLSRLRPIARVAIIGMGVLSMMLALVTIPLLREGATLITGHLDNIDEFGVNPTIFTIAVGPSGWLLHGALVVIAGVAVVRSWPSNQSVSEPRPLPAADP